MKSKQSIKAESCISLKEKKKMVVCTFMSSLNTIIMNRNPYFSSLRVLRWCHDHLSLPTSEKSQRGQIPPSVIVV